jgi:antitoxin (DNA-binding transcriptional repressor) of toxin-antitoxin stability system
MDDVTLPYAKEHLEDLVSRALRGEDVCISDPKLGTIRLAPVNAMPQAVKLYPERVIGQWRGRIAEIPDERLFAPLTDEELAWLSGASSGDH